MDKLRTYRFIVEESRIVTKEYWIDEYDYKTAKFKASVGEYDDCSDSGQSTMSGRRVLHGERIIFNDEEE